MGTPFDWFGPESWPNSPAVTPVQRAHRLLLRMVVEKHGFQPYAQEWWHFTLINEPFPGTYFDFPVQSVPFRFPGAVSPGKGAPETALQALMHTVQGGAAK